MVPHAQHNQEPSSGGAYYADRAARVTGRSERTAQSETRARALEAKAAMQAEADQLFQWLAEALNEPHVERRLFIEQIERLAEVLAHLKKLRHV